MSHGRTTWSPRDAATHDRELVVELGEEFGPAGPYVHTVLCDLAQQQRDGGSVRSGLRSLARKTFTDPALVRRIVEYAGEIGALDDLEIDEDGRRFTCRISGWDADQRRGRDAWKKHDKRHQTEGDTEGQEGTSPQNGTTTPPERTYQTRPEKNNDVEPARLDEARERIRSEHITRVFETWIEAAGKTNRTVLDDKRRRLIRRALEHYPLDDVLDAVRGWKRSPHHRGENSTSTVYNDLGLLLRDGEHIERFRDLERARDQRSPDEPRTSDERIAAAERRDQHLEQQRRERDAAMGGAA